jgi:2-oxo-3-hexenedioate decarboxylase
VQAELRRHASARGGRRAGFKAGLTSAAKMRQMGVEVPTVGFLLAEHGLRDGASIRLADLIHPRVEPEVAFVLKTALRGPGCTAADVLAATQAVAAALEVIDSRYASFRFDLPSVIADDNSAARHVLGAARRDPHGLALDALGVVLEKNGEVVARGTSAAVLGHPASAVAMIANHVGAAGEELAAGSLVLSGGITEAIAVERCDRVTARLDGLGSVSVTFV